MANNSTTDNQTIKDICVDPVNFDIQRFLFKDPHTDKFTIGELKIESTLADARYLNDADEECAFYYTAPTQSLFGANYSFDMGTPKDKQTPDNAKGLQTCYPMTSLTTMKNPTLAEKAHRNMLTAIWQKAYEHGYAQATGETSLIPGSSVNSFMAAGMKKKPELAIKLPYGYRNDPKDNTKKNTTLPEVMYIKFFTKGKGETLRCETRIYGPGDKEVNGLSIVSQQGQMTPVIKLEGIYFGAHGPTAPQGASLRLKVAEANWIPGGGASKLPSKRMAPPNPAPSHEEGGVPRLPGRPLGVAKSKALGVKPPGAPSVPQGGEAQPPVNDPVAAITAATKAPSKAKTTTPAKSAAPPVAKAKTIVGKGKAPAKKTPPPPPPADDEAGNDDQGNGDDGQ